MVDPRAKGARAEAVIRDELRRLTGHKWERTPGSGTLNEKHGLKGDLYIPNEKNIFCVEAKHYAEARGLDYSQVLAAVIIKARGKSIEDAYLVFRLGDVFGERLT